jgi:hypothetical protein
MRKFTLTTVIALALIGTLAVSSAEAQRLRWGGSAYYPRSGYPSYYNYPYATLPYSSYYTAPSTSYYTPSYHSNYYSPGTLYYSPVPTTSYYYSPTPYGSYYYNPYTYTTPRYYYGWR